MFKSFFKKNDDEDIFETVDPIVEKRRNEKFSKPLIYDEEFKEKDNHEEKENIQKEVNMLIPKGASTSVDDVAIKIIKNFGFDKLNHIAKLNFKNTDKIKEKLKEI